MALLAVKTVLPNFSTRVQCWGALVYMPGERMITQSVSVMDKSWAEHIDIFGVLGLLADIFKPKVCITVDKIAH